MLRAFGLYEQIDFVFISNTIINIKHFITAICVIRAVKARFRGKAPGVYTFRIVLV